MERDTTTAQERIQAPEHPSLKIKTRILREWGLDKVLFVDNLPIYIFSELVYELQKQATLDAMRTIEEEKQRADSERDFVARAGLMPSRAFRSTQSDNPD